MFEPFFSNTLQRREFLVSNKNRPMKSVQELLQSMQKAHVKRFLETQKNLNDSFDSTQKELQLMSQWQSLSEPLK